MTKKTQITVRVPATTANLGPGFDCLGMAVDIWNEIIVDLYPDKGSGQTIVVEGMGSKELPTSQENLICRSINHLFTLADVNPPAMHIKSYNNIPLGRGLGSSAAAIVGGLMVANAIIGITGKPFGTSDLLDIAAKYEGHPDNVTPAILGGLQIVVKDDEQLISSSVKIPDDLGVVLFIPDFIIPTKDARLVMPENISVKEAVYNIGRAALLINSLNTASYFNLKTSTEDSIHQPHRQKLFPAMNVIFREAIKAGAMGVFLSGSGSTILALTKGKEMTVAYEMYDAARKTGISGNVKISKPSIWGAHLV